MKATRVGLAIVLALALQTTLAGLAAGTWARVDLVLVVVVYVGLTAGPVTGLWTGTVGGIAQDVLSGGIVGVGGLAKTITGFLIGLVGSQFIVDHPVQRFVVFFVATIVHAMCFLGVYGLLDSPQFATSYTVVLSEALANALVGVLAFELIELGPGVIQRRRLRRASVARRRLGDWRMG